MVEVTGNLWTYPADIRVITTNGFVKNNGEAVMGRGCALEAAQRWPDLPRTLGRLLRQHGNHVFAVPPSVGILNLYTFPVKHRWMERADLALIERSAHELVEALHLDLPAPFSGVCVIPRPGCGNGQLLWRDVRPLLERVLDDKFHIITF